jgi:ABC-2 type transport system ATP-binding protein
MSKSEPAIQMSGIAKSFGKKSVLASIDGSIEQGKAVGLLGENGSGKTTLFRILLDALMPNHGEFLIFGMRPDGTGAIRNQIGYIPERPAFHLFMTTGEVLKFRSKLYNNWNFEFVAASTNRLKLDLNTKISAASKGTLAKLAWICATAYDSRLLLLDEPTSGLDLLVRESVLNGLIQQLQEQGKTIVVANHRMEEMMNLLDELWLLAGGKIIRKVNLDDLRNSARRITGRLRKEIPGNLKIFEEHRTGGLVSWLTLDRETLAAIQELALLDQMEVSAISPETSLKVLLKEGQ